MTVASKSLDLSTALSAPSMQARIPLLPLKDETYLMHSSLRQEKGIDNETLEFVGDRLMRALLTLTILHLYPTIDLAACSRMTSSLESNANFALWSARCGLPQMLRSNGTQQLRSKTQADVFEAYIAQAVREHTFEDVGRWLLEHFRDDIEAAYEHRPSIAEMSRVSRSRRRLMPLPKQASALRESSSGLGSTSSSPPVRSRIGLATNAASSSPPVRSRVVLATNAAKRQEAQPILRRETLTPPATASYGFSIMSPLDWLRGFVLSGPKARY